MALIIKNGLDLYHKINFVWDDPRMRDKFLMANPFQPIVVLTVYLYFVFKWGPKFMANRQPMKLHQIIKFYNLLQVAICLCITIKGYYHTFGQGYSFFCEPVDYSLEYHPVEITKVAYYYLMTKVIDLLDTVFFVLKKKQSHVSFLHVYHHAGMVALSWVGVKYFPGGQSVFMGIINSLVHVIMYFYYYLTSVDNKYKQSAWKKYITQLQMIQFGLMALHWLALRLSPECGFPKFVTFFMLPQNFFIFVLFYDFYRTTYMKKPSAVSEVTESGGKIDLNNNVDLNDKSKSIEHSKIAKAGIVNYEKSLSD